MIDGNRSKWTSVTSGVPQGTILGLILFPFFIDDLPSIIEHQVKLLADDAKFYHNIEDAISVQDDLDAISAWSKDWLISFNNEKCVVLRVRKALEWTYFLNGQPLTEVSEQKDLGIIISNYLKPTKHIASICKKANQRLGMIRRCFSNHSREVILPLYKPIVPPLIENSSPAWTPWLQHDINNLDKMQKRCLKLCTDHIEIEHLSTRRQKVDMKETSKYTDCTRIGHY